MKGRRGEILQALAVGLVLAVWSCGGGAGTRGAGDGGSGIAGRRDGGAGQGGSAGGPQCPATGGLAAEPSPRQQVALDAPVPITELAYALAVARCNYWSRCFGLSTYVANECVDSLAANESWRYGKCGPDSLGYGCFSVGTNYVFPSDALVQAVLTGVVHYDAQLEAQCLAALMSEGCASSSLLEGIAPCVAVFTCPAATDGGAPSPDGGAPDGGSACAQLAVPAGTPLPTCTSDDDCAGVTGYPEGPQCVAGFCAASRCGFAISGCTSFAAAGETCNGNDVSILGDSVPLMPDGICGPGLGCQGVTAAGGLGTCVVPVDVGGACSDDVNCKPGLVCACGACQIPPSSGPCLNGACRVGVAYCDSSNVCRPVRGAGASCSDAINACGVDLVCLGGFCGTPN